MPVILTLLAELQFGDCRAESPHTRQLPLRADVYKGRDWEHGGRDDTRIVQPLVQCFIPTQSASKEQPLPMLYAPVRPQGAQVPAAFPVLMLGNGSVKIQVLMCRN